MSDLAIAVRRVSKCYRIFDSQRSRLAHTLWRRHGAGMSEVWALRDVSFDVAKGESVAIIGRNGSGKSTLLEIITGTMAPSAGEVEVHGRIAALLELGSGFNPEYTGRENVTLSGQLMGLSRGEVAAKFDEIVGFADVGEVLDRPVKTYSSGMMVRLAFAVQVALQPEILIVDEALSVGDFFFQQKCLARVRELQAHGTTVLFVSHDMQTVRDLCGKGLILDRGVVRFWGDNMTAISRYLATDPSPAAAAPERAASAVGRPEAAVSRLEAPVWQRTPPHPPIALLAVGVYDGHGRPALVVEVGGRLAFKVRFLDDGAARHHVTLTLRNRYNQVVTAFGTYTHGVRMPRQHLPAELELTIDLSLQIEAGEYSFQFNIGKITGPSRGVALDETPWLGPLRVSWDYEAATPPFFGMCGLPAEFRIVAVDAQTVT